jgi:hypothetical protein
MPHILERGDLMARRGYLSGDSLVAQHLQFLVKMLLVDNAVLCRWFRPYVAPFI